MPLRDLRLMVWRHVAQCTDKQQCISYGKEYKCALERGKMRCQLFSIDKFLASFTD